MKNRNKINYQELYDRVGSSLGWNFSKVKVLRKGQKWDFYQVVANNAHPNSILLDIGTGGGSRILKISHKFLFTVGIDLSANMIKTAKQNSHKLHISNVRFFQMDAKKLEFPEGFFDIVSCRHSPFYPDQIFKVLKKEEFS